MKRSLLFTFVFAGIIGHGQELHAQVEDPINERGPFSAIPSILSLRESTRPPGSADLVLLKEPGNQTSPPNAWSQPPLGGPDYSLQALFPYHHEVIELNGMSTGNALIPTVDGVVDFTTVPWAACMISVSNDVGSSSSAGPNNWLEAREVGALGPRLTPGSDLVTHYFEGSSGLVNGIAGSTYLTQTAEMVGFGGASVDDDIDALDIAMGTVRANSGASTGLLFKNGAGEFYFTVHPSCVVALDRRFAIHPGVGLVGANAATIYKMTWTSNPPDPNGVVTGSWSLPRVFLTPLQLGLDKNVDSIDALDVDPGLGTTSPAAVAFSTQRFVGRSQLLVYEGDPNENVLGSVNAIRDINGRPAVTLALGLGEDEQNGNVDAVCFFDPEEGRFDSVMGIPYRMNGPRPELSLDTMRAGNACLFQVNGRLYGEGASDLAGPDTGTLRVRVQCAHRYNLLAADPVLSSWSEVADTSLAWNGLSTGGICTELTATVTHASIGQLPGQAYRNLAFRAQVYDSSASDGSVLAESWVSVLRR